MIVQITEKIGNEGKKTIIIIIINCVELGGMKDTPFDLFFNI